MIALSFYLKPQIIEVSILKDGVVEDFLFRLDEGKTHAGELVPKISEVLKSKNIKNIDYVVTSKGPGSFTNIRLQLATALGFKLGYNCNAYAVDSIQALENVLNLSETALVNSYRGGGFIKSGDNIIMVDDNHLDSLSAIFKGDSPKARDVNMANSLLKTYMADDNKDSHSSLEPFYVFTPIYAKRKDLKCQTN